MGEHLFIAGLVPCPKDVEEWEEGRQIRTAPIVSTGVVSQVFPEGRDRVMLPGPVVIVDCASWGGMSGAPVFDEHGRLVGLLSCSFSQALETGPSAVSLVWPALAHRIVGGWPAPEGACSLLQRPMCCIDRPDAIRPVYLSDGSVGSVTYTRW